MKKIQVGILGFGNVGSGTVQVLTKRKNEISTRTGVNIEIKKICDLHPPQNIDFGIDKKVFTKNADELLNDPEISIVAELIGGIDFAKTFITKALKNGKNVVTANKHLLALHGNELFDLAKKQNKMLFCEAAVAGAIPCLRTLKKSMPSGQLNAVRGILNGTTNYILSKLQYKGGDFKDGLEMAKEKGYTSDAEAPLDVDGIDAAHKVAILAAFAFGAEIDFKKVYIQGISNLISEDFRIAEVLGYKIKLVGNVEKINNEIFMSVRPTLVKKFSKIGQIDGVMNGIIIEDDFSGPILLEGYGAGGLATGTSVAADIAEIAQHAEKNQITDSLPFKKLKKIKYGNSSDLRKKTMMRIIVKDNIGILAKIGKAFADEKVSIDAVFQKPYSEKIIPVILILEESKIENIERAVKKIAKMSFVSVPPVIFPIDENE